MSRALVLSALLLLALGAASAAPAAGEPAEVSRPYDVSFGVKIPMPDGVKLNATVIRPHGQTGRLPVVLTFTPYGADRYYPIAAYFAEHGYVGAIVEVRGRGDSGGTFTPYVNDAADGYQAVEWLARQPWSDGRVVMRGASYTGYLQWAVAAMKPPALKTIIPGAPPYHGVDSPDYRGVPMPYRLRWYSLVAGLQRNTSFNEDDDYWRGLFAELGRGEIAYKDLDKAAGMPNDYWSSGLRAAEGPKAWLALDPTPSQLAAMDIPVLAVTGAYDGAQLGSLEHFERYLRANPTAGAKSVLLMGPWNHAGVSGRQTSSGGVDFGRDAGIDHPALHLAWFDYVLKGGPKPAFLKDKVTYYVLGPNVWSGAKGLDATNHRDYLLSSPTAPPSVAAPGALVERAATRERADRFTYDPRRPAIAWHPYHGPAAGGATYLRNDPAPARLGDAALVYETSPAQAAFLLRGRPTLNLRATVDVPDTDLTAVLYVVEPDGGTTTLSYDLLRAKYRNGVDRTELLKPGAATTFTFDMTWIGRRIEAGERLRLVITSPGVSYFFQRNDNTGADPAEGAAGAARPAHIDVQVGRGGTVLRLPVEPAS